MTDAPLNALKAMMSKRDERDYLDTPVPADVLDRILNAARMAGSAKNRQPIRLIVVTDPDMKEKLKAGGDFAAWIHRAPVLVVVTVRQDAGPRSLFDVGRHAQNLMVAGQALGLTSCPVTLIHQDEVRAALGLPDDVDGPMLISLGYPAEEQAASPIAGPRVDLDAYVAREFWN